MPTDARPQKPKRHPSAPTFGAIDLGTNNCRLLVATPTRNGFRVVDAFSRIVRLGQGLSSTGALSEAAMDRTVDALKICAEKMASRRVAASRCIATEACRAASNGDAFLERIKNETGLTFDIITPEVEAELSVRGCHDLIDPEATAVLVFDIGGGSTELSWVRVSRDANGALSLETAAWTSVPVGVVSLAERNDGPELSAEIFSEMAKMISARVAETSVPDDVRQSFQEGRGHLIGTSGTVTSLAGVHLQLARYSRRDVDGLWLTTEHINDVTAQLQAIGFEGRAAQPCIGRDRADLVVPGCAILDGILQAWPAARIRVGDRGLREGLLIDLIERWRAPRK